MSRSTFMFVGVVVATIIISWLFGSDGMNSQELHDTFVTTTLIFILMEVSDKGSR